MSLAAEAEQELTEAALFYAREAGAALGHAFLSEFERSAALIIEQPRLGAVWWRCSSPALRRFPDDEIRVLAVAHRGRKPGFWRGRT
jgi:hypothetical protein